MRLLRRDQRDPQFLNKLQTSQFKFKITPKVVYQRHVFSTVNGLTLRPQVA